MTSPVRAGVECMNKAGGSDLVSSWWQFLKEAISVFIKDVTCSHILAGLATLTQCPQQTASWRNTRCQEYEAQLLA